MTGLYKTVGAGYSPDRGNVCEADKRVPVFGENPRPPEESAILHKANGNASTVGACTQRPETDSREGCPYALRMTFFLQRLLTAKAPACVSVPQAGASL